MARREPVVAHRRSQTQTEDRVVHRPAPMPAPEQVVAVASSLAMWRLVSPASKSALARLGHIQEVVAVAPRTASSFAAVDETLQREQPGSLQHSIAGHRVALCNDQRLFHECTEVLQYVPTVDARVLGHPLCRFNRKATAEHTQAAHNRLFGRRQQMVLHSNAARNVWWRRSEVRRPVVSTWNRWSSLSRRPSTPARGLARRPAQWPTECRRVGDRPPPPRLGSRVGVRSGRQPPSHEPRTGRRPR